MKFSRSSNAPGFLYSLVTGITALGGLTYVPVIIFHPDIFLPAVRNPIRPFQKDASTHLHLFLRRSHVRAEFRLQRYNTGVHHVPLPMVQQLFQLLRLFFREVVNLPLVLAEVVQLPLLRPFGLRDKHRFPIGFADCSPTAEVPPVHKAFRVYSLLPASKLG